MAPLADLCLRYDFHPYIAAYCRSAKSLLQLATH